MNQAAKTRKIFDGRYEILSIVGRGACSVVYHARHVSSPASSVALKVLLESKGRSPSAERLRREALAMVSCRHKYVARLDDFHSVGSLCYLSMEYCPESDMRAYTRQHNNRLEPVQAERFLKQASEGLSFIHKAGIIHRDLKPENILVASDKEIRITDFGVALLPGEQASISDLQSGVGTMNYMAPEILEGQFNDQRSDIYALGIVFYEALCGVNPFEDVHLADQIEARRDGNIAPIRSLVPAVPAHLSAVLERAIRYSSSERYQTAEDLLKDLLDKKSASYGKNNSKKRQARNESQQPEPKNRVRGEAGPRDGGRPKQDTIFEATEPAAQRPAETAAAESADTRTAVQHQPGEETINPDPPQQLLSTGQTEAVEALIEPEPAQPLAVEPPVNEATATIQPTAVPSHEDTQEIVRPNRRPSTNISRETIEKIRANYLPQQPPPRRGPRFDFPAFTLFTISVVFFLALFLPAFRQELNRLSIRYLRVDMAASIGKLLNRTEPSVLPVFSATEFAFPALPDGVYTGQIKNLLPGRNLPLMLVSFAEQDRLVVIVSMEGWTPVVINPQALQELAAPDTAKPLRVASNGIIVDLTGQNIDGELFGYFRNVITGVQGEWTAKPLRQQVKVVYPDRA